jgi:hypothetical protein
MVPARSRANSRRQRNDERLKKSFLGAHFQAKRPENARLLDTLPNRELLETVASG